MPYVEQLPSGKYRALYRDNAGKRRSAGTFDHKRKAESAAAVAEADARKLGWKDPAAGLRTWGSWADEWWHTRGVEAGTLARDLSRLNNHLRPRWNDVALAHITRHDVKSWAAGLSATLAPASVQRCVHLFSASMTAAIDAEIVSSNPAYKIRIASGEVSEHRYLTLEEFGALVDQMPTDFDKALTSLMVACGPRWGEAVGVQLKRLDMPRANLRIAEVWDDAMHRVKPYPKGKKIRDVPMPDWLIEQLHPVVNGRRNGFLFDVNGTPPNASNWRTRVWFPALRRANIGHVRIHDLRHTFASWLIQGGLPLAEVGKLMGHQSPMTTQTYAHLADTPRAHILRALPNPRGASVGQTEATPGFTPLRLASSGSNE